MTLPIKVWLMPPGPNPWKVIHLLLELSVPYTLHPIAFTSVKSPPFTSINPNGRVPAIEDPNTGLVLWESGAIILYLIEQYDTEKKFTYTDLVRRNHLNQFLMFQMSGQGPYFGQAGWFSVLHPEKVPSAIERYRGEVRRVFSVLETVLEGREWLVGDKVTFADLAFLPWNDRSDAMLGVAREERFAGFPNVEAWHKRMEGRECWRKCMEIRERLMDEQGLMPNGMPKGVGSVKEYMELVEKKRGEDSQV